MTDASQRPKDPWTDKPKTLSKKKASKKASAPPFKRWLSTFYTHTGFKKASRNSITRIIFSLVFNALLLWTALGFFNVAPNEQAVIMRFGKYQKTLSSGLHWHMRLIDRVVTLNTQPITRYLPPLDIITQEGHLISAKAEIKYRISNSHAYLFSSKTPVETLYYLSLKALHETLNQYTTMALLNEEESIQIQAQEKLQSLLNQHSLGLNLIQLTVRSFELPEAVQSNFEAIKQTQIEVNKLQQQAETEAALTKQNAALQAEALLFAANTYQKNTMLETHKDWDRFLMLLPQYKKAPKPTLQKLHLEALENILKRNPKIVIWNENASSMDKKGNLQLNLSLDTLLKIYSTKFNVTAGDLSSKMPTTATTLPKNSLVSQNNASNAPIILGGYD